MPFALILIPDGLIDTRTPTPQYSADFASIVGNAADNSDGFEDIFSTMAGHLADAPNFTAGIDLAISDLGNVGDPMHTPFEQDFSDSLHASISQGQGDFDAFAVHLTGNNPPASGGGGTGSGGPTTGNCGANNPLSTTGAFTGVKCDQKQTFRVLNVSGGACSYKQPQTPRDGGTSWPRIQSFTLQSGDATVWTLGHHQEKFSDGTLVDHYDITVTPKLLPAVGRNLAPARIGVPAPDPHPVQNPSHFDAVGVLVTTHPNTTQHICMSVDCIP